MLPVPLVLGYIAWRLPQYSQVALQGRASQSQKVQDMTVGQLKKSASDLRKGLCQAERERQTVEARLEQLGAELARLQSNMQEADANCAQLRQAQAGIRGELDMLGLRKFQVCRLGG